MIHVVATIELEEGMRSAFLKLFLANVPLVEAEDGCVEYVATVDVPTEIPVQEELRENFVTVVEKWRDLEALMAHLQTPHMLAYREKVKDLVRGVSLQVMKPA